MLNLFAINVKTRHNTLGILQEKNIQIPIVSYQMKLLLIVTKIVTKLDFGC